MKERENKKKQKIKTCKQTEERKETGDPALRMKKSIQKYSEEEAPKKSAEPKVQRMCLNFVFARQISRIKNISQQIFKSPLSRP